MHSPADVEEGRIEWKRGAAIGAVFLLVGLVSAWAGWESESDIQPQQAERAIEVAMPPAEAVTTTETPPSPAQIVEETPADRFEPAAIAPVPVERVPTVPPRIASTDQQIEPTQVEQVQSPENAADNSVAGSATAETVVASLPLPNRVIARTIERIGYACGEIASTLPVDGEAAGVFKVTCTSGQSYQARPVNGRYRFRRWDRN